ncbi:hypothetical protein GWN75_07980 [candidate division KSB1 bacterium]|nr:hypothetical protein [candidate division KSB1 bacterium]NIS23831.1 hypothetical protein [candidate division KSB1 bacterium]NIU24472.1 hypothetical protein [candidate division KSB1 bacterium]NIW18327.1 hypothetical protein [candidate division KSB1 bacterium]
MRLKVYGGFHAVSPKFFDAQEDASKQAMGVQSKYSISNAQWEKIRKHSCGMDDCNGRHEPATIEDEHGEKVSPIYDPDTLDRVYLG